MTADIVALLADHALATLPDAQLVALCPPEYGTDITLDHRCFAYDMFYDHYASLAPDELRTVAEQLCGSAVSRSPVSAR